MYGSRDESPDYYCSDRYDLLTRLDLKTGELDENIFASRDPNDQVLYGNAYLHTTDNQYKNGKYYLYYCLANLKNTEGVATSLSPTGPFTNGIHLAGMLM